MTIKGFEQTGGVVTGNIGELVIESVQNTTKIEGESTNYSIGTNTQIIGKPTGPDIMWNNTSPGTISIGGNTTSGERAYVDTPTKFVVGEGSDLTIEKATNTGALIGAEDNGKIKIKEYEGRDIENYDRINTTGGTISTGGIGIEYQDKEKEGITRNTVIGNVEIEKPTGAEINRDIDKMQETTKDEDSGHYNTFVESDVLKLITEEGRAEFVENLEKAKQNSKVYIDEHLAVAKKYQKPYCKK